MFLEIAAWFFSFYLGQPYPTPRGLRHYPSCTPEPGPTSAAEQLRCNTPAKSYVNLLTVSKDSSTHIHVSTEQLVLDLSILILYKHLSTVYQNI